MVIYSRFTSSDEELGKKIAVAKEAGDTEEVERLLHLRIQNLIGFHDFLSR